MKDNNYDLILAYFDKTISDEGLTQLQHWIDRSAENQAQFIKTIRILEAARASLNTPKRAVQNLARVQAHAIANPITKHSIKKWKWLSVAAACLMIGLSGWFGYREYNNNLQPEYATISNADGMHAKIVLPDNSTVMLSGGTTLKYPKKFNGDRRMVILDGEAFFDVVHLKKRPFVVKTAKISTIVFGTSFNVKAYHADNKVAVTVLTGKVGVVTNMNGQEEMVKYLVKNEQININTQNGIYTFNKTDAKAVRSWVANNFVFYNAPFKDIATSLEHHYGVKIRFTDTDLGNIRLTAKFNNSSLNQAMDDLCTLSGLAYTQKHKQLFISHNNQKGGSIMK